MRLGLSAPLLHTGKVDVPPTRRGSWLIAAQPLDRHDRRGKSPSLHRSAGVERRFFDVPVK